MEYIGTWAKNDRLEALRDVLREMQISGINTSDKFIDERIAARVTRSTQRSQKDVIVLDSDSEDEYNDATHGFTTRAGEIVTPEVFEGSERIYVDVAKVRRTCQAQSEAMKRLWADSGFRAKIMAARNTPEAKAKFAAANSISSKARWKDEEIRERTVAAQIVAQQKAWNGPNRDVRRKKAVDNTTFKRNDSDPVAKKKWDEKIKVANDFAAGLDADGLRTQVTKSFQVLQLNAAAYGEMPGPRRKGFAQASSPEYKAKSAFFERALTGDPFFTDDDIDQLSKDVGWVKDKANLKACMRTEVRLWLRAAAVLRLKGIHVDYASVPQLTWMQ